MDDKIVMLRKRAMTGDIDATVALFDMAYRAGESEILLEAIGCAVSALHRTELRRILSIVSTELKTRYVDEGLTNKTKTAPTKACEIKYKGPISIGAFVSMVEGAVQDSVLGIAENNIFISNKGKQRISGYGRYNRTTYSDTNQSENGKKANEAFKGKIGEYLIDTSDIKIYALDIKASGAQLKRLTEIREARLREIEERNRVEELAKITKQLEELEAKKKRLER